MNPLHGWKPPAPPPPPAPVPVPVRAGPSGTVAAWQSVANQNIPAKHLEELNKLNTNTGYCDIAIPRDIERHVRERRKLLAMGHDASTIPDSAKISAEDLLADEADEYRVLYCTFVDQYMIDFDPRLAAIRCGFNGFGEPSEAAIVAMNLMGLPVVQRLIAEYSTGRRSGNSTTLELVFAMLHRETQVNVAGSTQKGRLEAIKALGELAGHIQKEQPRESDVRGVVEIPQMLVKGSAEAEWEEVAVASQKALKDSVRN